MGPYRSGSPERTLNRGNLSQINLSDLNGTDLSEKRAQIPIFRHSCEGRSAFQQPHGWSIQRLRHFADSQRRWIPAFARMTGLSQCHSSLTPSIRDPIDPPHRRLSAFVRCTGRTSARRSGGHLLPVAVVHDPALRRQARLMNAPDPREAPALRRWRRPLARAAPRRAEGAVEVKWSDLDLSQRFVCIPIPLR